MRLAVIGAGGNTGRRVVAEAVARGHQVTPVGRAEFPDADLAGYDVVVTATRPAPGFESELAAVTRPHGGPSDWPATNSWPHAGQSPKWTGRT